MEFEELKKKADSGDPEAQVAVGHAYVYANNVTRDLKEGLKWYEMADRQRGTSHAANVREILRLEEDYDISKACDLATKYDRICDRFNSLRWLIEACEHGNYEARTEAEARIRKRFMDFTDVYDILKDLFKRNEEQTQRIKDLENEIG